MTTRRVCISGGCTAIAQPGTSYCARHTTAPKPFDRALFKPKSPEAIRFYHSAAWVNLSRQFRQAHPLCVRCLDRGIRTASALVHHNPEREELIARGDSPLDTRYLEALCHTCHNAELTKKRAPRDYRAEARADILHFAGIRRVNRAGRTSQSEPPNPKSP